MNDIDIILTKDEAKSSHPGGRRRNQPQSARQHEAESLVIPLPYSSHTNINCKIN